MPIYLNYVKDARRAEAKGGLGAIQTGEQVYFQKNSTYKSATNTQAITDSLNVDLNDPAVNWNFSITGASATGYTADALGKNNTPASGLEVKLVYSKVTGAVMTDIS